MCCQLKDRFKPKQLAAQAVRRNQKIKPAVVSSDATNSARPCRRYTTRATDVSRLNNNDNIPADFADAAREDEPTNERNIPNMMDSTNNSECSHRSSSASSQEEERHDESTFSRMVREIEIEVNSDRSQTRDINAIRQGLEELRALNASNEQRLNDLLYFRASQSNSPPYYVML